MIQFIYFLFVLGVGLFVQGKGFQVVFQELGEPYYGYSINWLDQWLKARIQCCTGSVARNHQGHIRDIQEAMQCQESKAGCILQLHSLPVSHLVVKNPVLAEESMLESPK